MQARLALLQGDVDRAVIWANAANPTADNQMMFFFEVPRLTLARVLIAMGDRDSLTRALDVLAERLALARVMQQARRVLEIKSLQAIALDGLGRRQEALEALDMSLTIADAGEFISSFLEAGPPMARLLRAMAKTERHANYVQRLLSHLKPVEPGPVSRTRKHSSGELIVPLTDRELDVLDLLQNRLTYKEIGSKLIISPLTVRKHVQNILPKLT